MRSLRVSLLAAFLLFALWTLAPAFDERSRGGGPTADTLPVSVGERLVYTVKWDPPWYLFFLPKMEAGELDLRLAELSEFKDRQALKIVLRARSSGALAKLAGMKVEDEFVIYSEPGTLCTRGVFTKIREGKRRRQLELEYYGEEGKLHFREMDEAVVPPKLKKDVVKSDIPSCVQDPFSALYYYRSSPLKIAHKQRFVIGNDDKIREVQTLVEKQEPVQTPAGTFPSWKIRTDALKGGLFKEGGQFRFWLSADERKLPVQFEAKVSLGRVLGLLKSITP